jgi:hypothetical protein
MYGKLCNEKKFVEKNFYYQFMSISSLVPMTCRIFEFNESRGIQLTSSLMNPFKTSGTGGKIVFGSVWDTQCR